MVGKQPLHLLDNPSGYVSGAVYKPAPYYLIGTGPVNNQPNQPYPPSVQGRTDQHVASAQAVQGHTYIPVPTAMPPRGINLVGGIRFPFRISYHNIGINAWRAGSI